jgi:hypothetical protein
VKEVSGIIDGQGGGNSMFARGSGKRPEILISSSEDKIHIKNTDIKWLK